MKKAKDDADYRKKYATRKDKDLVNKNIQYITTLTQDIRFHFNKKCHSLVIFPATDSSATDESTFMHLLARVPHGLFQTFRNLFTF